LERIEAPIAEALPAARRSMEGQIRRSEKLHDLFFREMLEYPTFAWQEALINAVAHRDYAELGREIEIWFYDDRMEVLSPGSLVPPVTLKDLRDRRPIHASRNPLIARVLVEAGIMREEGEGIPRIFEEMEASFLKHPALETPSGAFKVTLRNEPIFSGPSREWQSLIQKLPLTVAQRRILLAKPEGFANEDYRRLNKVNRDQAYREIQEMVEKGVLSPSEGSGRGAVYRVSPDLKDARAWLEARVPQIQSILTQKGRLKNSDYREAFGVTRHTALSELRRLVAEGFLRLEGERRGARYVEGPLLEGSGGD
jgi:ATP-dependent DNA helicase RecG